VLVLRGKVPTFYTRQVALALVMKVAGVDQVDDRIVVDSLAIRHK
jgi:osmotically-inducible protein OsmY